MALRRVWLVLVVALIAACVPAIAHAGATVTRVPLSLTIGDECGLGEPIEAEGHMIVVSTFESHTEGIFHERFVAEAHLLGTGLVTGDRYIFNATGQIAESTFVNGSSMVMESDMVVEIHAGETVPLDDFFMRVAFNPAGHVFDETACR
jgi:hypothetical protein